MTASVQLIPLAGFPLVEPRDDLAQQIVAAVAFNALTLADDDIVVIAQKIVSKAENRYAYLNDMLPSPRALELAREAEKDPRLVECILQESTEVMRVRPGAIIVRHRNGYVHANAGIDQSNIHSDPLNPRVLLLPDNPDVSALQLRHRLRGLAGVDVGIVINDSAGRPWRNGVTGFAIGTAGFTALDDRIGKPDLYERPLEITQVAIADEIAAAASMLMGQGNEGVPVVIVRGLQLPSSNIGSHTLIRDPATDLFR